MKNLTAIILLLAFAFAASPQEIKPDAYPLTVHVIYSGWKTDHGTKVQALCVIIDGATYILSGPLSGGALERGAYKARRIELQNQKHESTGADYVLSLPDGRSKRLAVVGISREPSLALGMLRSWGYDVPDVVWGF